MVFLDTTFLVDVLKGRQNAASLLEKYESLQETIYISSVSIMELIRGACLSEHSKKEEEKVLGLISSFSELLFDYESATLAGKIEADLIKKGVMIEVEDCMIAATALVNDEVIVTRNKKHFERIPDLKLETY